MSNAHPSVDKRDPAPQYPPSTYLELVHAEESEILSWAVKTAISDLGTEIGHIDDRILRQDLCERKRIFLMLLKRLIEGWKRTGDS